MTTENPLSTARAKPRVIVVSGLSGGGKSTALNALEDLGYYCVDNLPAVLLEGFARQIIDNPKQYPMVAPETLVLETSIVKFPPANIARLRGDVFDLSFQFRGGVDTGRRPACNHSGTGHLSGLRF